MRLQDYKLIFVAVGLIGSLLVASPVIGVLLPLPAGEEFSELYLLGPGHMADGYPYNVAVGQNYSVYAGVGNHLGSAGYYLLCVKFLNRTDLLPNATSGVPSAVQPVYDYRFAVADNQTWEAPLTFSVANASVEGDQSVVKQLAINDVVFDVNKPVAWDSNSTSYGYRLLFELWLYDAGSHAVQFHNRFVYLQLNLTELA